jgi:hypothetical protein
VILSHTPAWLKQSSACHATELAATPNPIASATPGCSLPHSRTNNATPSLQVTAVSPASLAASLTNLDRVSILAEALPYMQVG